MPAKNKQRSAPPKEKWYFALAAEPVFNRPVIQQKSIPNPIKIGWYSKQQEQFGNKYAEYQNQDNKIVIVTEITDIGGTSNWPDAVHVGYVTKYIRTICDDSE